MKTCSACGEMKPLSEYYLRLGKPESRCKRCRSDYKKEYWKRNKKELSIKKKEYYEANKNRFREINIEKCREYRQKNKDKINTYQRKIYKLKKYSLLHYHRKKDGK